MSSHLYRSFLRLLEKWPVDPTKTGRDLGEYIRSGVAVAFRGGSDEPRDSQKCSEIHDRLNAIVSNKYKTTFHSEQVTSALGLSQANCRECVSNEFLKLMEEEEKTAKDKLSSYFKK